MIPRINSLFGGKGGREAGPAEERPSSGSLAIGLKMAGAGRLKSELSSLSMFQDVKEDGGTVRAMIVESTDRNKKPHLFITFAFGQKALDVEYSMPPEVPNGMVRKLGVMKSVFTLLSLLESRGVLVPDRGEMYTKMLEAFTISSAFADTDVLRMKHELDSARAKGAAMAASLSALKAEKEGLSLQLLEVEKKCQLLEGRVKQLEGMTDAELDREIIRWVEDHSGKLNDARFCESLGIATQRLEERLDSLSKRGVIRIV